MNCVEIGVSNPGVPRTATLNLVSKIQLVSLIYTTTALTKYCSCNKIDRF